MPTKPELEHLNQHLNQRVGELVRIACQPSRCILGLMSGTSLDGVDLVLAQFSGAGTRTKWKLITHTSRLYTAAQRALIKAVAFQPQAPLAEVTTLNARLATQYAELILTALSDWGKKASQVDCIASHGQTIYHAPQSWQAGKITQNASLQIADGDHIALKTGIITISDFRQKAIAYGLEGAPLAPYAEALLFASDQPRLLINLGGIANYTLLPAKDAGKSPRYQDSGPANCLLDATFRHYWQQHDATWDQDGTLAQQGKVSSDWLRSLCQHPYLLQTKQRSSGPEEFGWDFLLTQLPLAKALKLSPQDMLATLCLFSAHCLTNALKNENIPPQTELFITGGGIHNKALMQHIKSQFEKQLPPLQWQNPEKLGVPPQAKEALLFATLANETLCGDNQQNIPSLGKISFPS